jgi:ketosteroid isomerase-like protein
MSRERVEILRRGYEAFNRRDIDAALEGMDPEVEWPNMLDGTTIRGRDAIREYWTKQFQLTDSRVEPQEFIEAGDRLVVVVHQVVRDQQGEPLLDHRVGHVYAFRDDKIARMDVYESRAEALEAAETTSP